MASAAVLLITGCGKKQTRVRVPVAPPVIETRSRTPQTRTPDTASEGTSRPLIIDVPANAKAIYTEVGLASWYGPPYHNRKAATGEIFDMYQLTAAHKTFPLNSIVRVTNLKTGQKAILRINDRGPFIGDRIIDLSMAAAKEIGTYRAGISQVKVELLRSPAPLDSGGRWCVQIGAFSDSDEAMRVKEKLMRKYKTAKVIQFSGPTGDWVRLRPANDDRSKAFEVAKATKVEEGGVFLVRLD
jgi:rare lipoprotein A